MFKEKLIEFLESNMDTKELEAKYGCSVGFIADGMIDSIQTSLRLSCIAKTLPEDFNSSKIEVENDR